MTELEDALTGFRDAMLAKFELRKDRHGSASVTIDGNLARLDPRHIEQHLVEELLERLDAPTTNNARDEDVDVANLLFLDWVKKGGWAP